MGYPPGVTGNEPQITGEWLVDIHEPFWAGINEFDTAGEYAVYFGNSEEHFFDNFNTIEDAQSFANALNQRWGIRSCDINKHGQCRICGDVITADW
jgi:hypothetical protein